MTETAETFETEQIFQCITDDAHKFWRVRITGTLQTVWYGRIGTAGHAQTKAFETPAEAQAATARIIAQKIARGYCRVTETEAVQVRPRKPVKRSAEQLLLFFEERQTLAAPSAQEKMPTETEPLTLF